jgi:putative tricarboxylic transport membrane protein
MHLDRWIALVVLIIAVIYGVSAFNYPLLPFERNLPVLPNTLPKGLSIIAAMISVFILLSPRTNNAPGDIDADQDTTGLQVAPALGLVAAMVLYALLLRPLGFVLATTSFIVGTAVMLGERRWWILIPVALAAAFGVWMLVQQLLGIYLKPWPGLPG